MEKNNITSKRMLDFYIKADYMMKCGNGSLRLSQE